MKTYCGSGGIASWILNLGTTWRRVVSFTPRERDIGTHGIGGWVDPRDGLDAVAKRNNPFIFPVGSRIPAAQPVVKSLY